MMRFDFKESYVAGALNHEVGPAHQQTRAAAAEFIVTLILICLSYFIFFKSSFIFFRSSLKYTFIDVITEYPVDNKVNQEDKTDIPEFGIPLDLSHLA